MSNRPFREHSLFQLTLVRFYEFWREPEAVFWTFGFPILLATGLGLAFRNQPPDPALVAIVRNGPEAERLAHSLSGDSRLRLELLDETAASRAMRTGKAVLEAIPAPGGSIDYRYDDTNPNARAARLIFDDALQRTAGRRDAIPTRDQLVREPGSRYIDFLLPGILGMNLMGNGIWGIGFPIVDARRRKLLKRLVASPMSRAQYLISFLFSRLLFVVLDLVVVLGFGHVVFGVPIAGSLGGIAVICLIAAFAFSSLGLLIASRASTMEAGSGIMNAVMVPMWIMSGVFFSSSRFPDAMQPFVRALPLTATIDALRANILEGAALSSVAPQLGILTVWLVLCFSVALRIFRWR